VSDPEFVFDYLPDQLFSLLPPIINCPVNRSDIIGLLYFSGYFGGQWLRAKLSSPPSGINPSFILPGISSLIDTGLQAADGSDPLSYTLGQCNSSVDSFGYNAGYLITIINNPPSGVTPDPKWNIAYDPTNALTVTMQTPQLLSSIELYFVWDTLLNNNRHQFSSQQAMYIQIQSTAYTRGVLTWTTALTVQGFNSVDYNLLLEASSSFLEIAQLNALSLTQSVGLQSEYLASNAAVMNVAYLAFVRGYSVGLLDASNDGGPLPFPHIVTN